MANDNLTIKLDGEVTLEDFAQAMQLFRKLVGALTAEFGRGTRITWLVDDLRPGSAATTVAAVAEKVEPVERVVHEYTVLGKALERGEPLAFPDRIVKPARGLTSMLGPRIHAVHFDTPEDGATIVSPTHRARPVRPKGAFGAVEGRVETLTRRKGLRFILYDAIHDRAVSCYLQEGQEDLMRDIWGKRALVEGWINRDPLTGMPNTVRWITELRTLPEIGPGAYRRARGVLQADPEGIPPETAVRRLRDAQ